MSTISPPRLKRRKLSRSEEPSSNMVPNCLSVFSHNINGIAPYLQHAITAFFASSQSAREVTDVPKASLRDFLRRHDWPTMLLLQEIKIRADDHSTIRALEKAVASNNDMPDGPDYFVHVCLPSDKHNARGFGGKVYGVATVVRKDWSAEHVETVRSVDWDVEGRFLVLETKRRGPQALALKLAIINVYAVNGTDSPYKDPKSGAVAGTRHDRKKAVHRHLAAECGRLQAEGFAVILAGDMNIARSAADGYPRLRTTPHQHNINRADFERKFFASAVASPDEDDQELKATLPTSSVCRRPADADNAAGLGMIDTFRFLHPCKQGYTYYPRGRAFGDSCDRVDMIIASASLRTYLTEAGMLETPAERGPSDHVPLFARFDFEFGKT